MTGKTQLLAYPDEPLRRVILIPLDRVSVIHWELVVEIVITFPDGNQSGDQMITRSVLVIKGRLSQPVCKRVDAECRLL
jgi:hypothetical protein